MNRRNVLEILHNPLEGVKVKVINHSDPTLVGRTGIVCTESRNMLFIEDLKGSIAVAKIPGTFSLMTSQGNMLVEGNLLEGDAKRRSKRKLRHW